MRFLPLRAREGVCVSGRERGGDDDDEEEKGSEGEREGDLQASDGAEEAHGWCVCVAAALERVVGRRTRRRSASLNSVSCSRHLVLSWLACAPADRSTLHQKTRSSTTRARLSSTTRVRPLLLVVLPTLSHPPTHPCTPRRAVPRRRQPRTTRTQGTARVRHRSRRPLGPRPPVRSLLRLSLALGLADLACRPAASSPYSLYRAPSRRPSSPASSPFRSPVRSSAACSLCSPLQPLALTRPCTHSTPSKRSPPRSSPSSSGAAPPGLPRSASCGPSPRSARSSSPPS